MERPFAEPAARQLLALDGVQLQVEVETLVLAEAAQRLRATLLERSQEISLLKIALADDDAERAELTEIKDRYDPHDLFSVRHGIRSSAAKGLALTGVA